MVTGLVVAFTIIVGGVLAMAIALLTVKQHAAPAEETAPTLSRPARAKSRCAHTDYEPVESGGVVVSNICLNPECGAQLGPVVSRDPDGNLTFSDQ